MQNGFIERFNRFFREDILDAYWFEDLKQLQILADKWKIDYNYYHPHKSLGRMAPCQFAKRHSKELVPWNELVKENIVNLQTV